MKCNSDINEKVVKNSIKKNKGNMNVNKFQNLNIMSLHQKRKIDATDFKPGDLVMQEQKHITV